MSASISSIFGLLIGCSHLLAVAVNAAEYGSSSPSSSSTSPLVHFTFRTDPPTVSSIGQSDGARRILAARGSSIRMMCRARLSTPLSPSSSASNLSGDSLNISWSLNGSRLVFEQSNSVHGVELQQHDTSLLIRELDDRNQGEYRCMAKLSAQVASTSDSITGAVLGEAVLVRLQTVPVFDDHDRQNESTITATMGEPVRLQCRLNGPASSSVTWLRNGRILTRDDSLRIRVYSTNTSARLHITSVEQADIGNYGCMAKTLSDSAVFSSNVTLNVTSTTSNVPNHGEPIVYKSNGVDNRQPNHGDQIVYKSNDVENVDQGSDIFLECLGRTNTTVRWRHSWELDDEKKWTPIETEDSIGSTLVIRNIRRRNSGTFTCTVTNTETGHQQTHQMRIFVRGLPIIIFKGDEQPVPIVTKRQGTTFRFVCPSYSDEADKALRIDWYKDGELVRPLGRFKIQPNSGFLTKDAEENTVTGLRRLQYRRDLLIADVQRSDQGFYQCFVSNAIGERSSVTLLRVEGSLEEEKISDVQIDVDHVRRRFNISWQLPNAVSIDEADGSIFLLNYYPEGSTSNNIPLDDVSCEAVNRRCYSTCCSSSYSIIPHHRYTMQMSMLRSAGISPLSDAVHVSSWDLVAQRSLPLVVTGFRSSGVELNWTPISEEEIKGQVTNYRIEYLERPMNSLGDELMSTPKTINIPTTRTRYRIPDLTLMSHYTFRVIPITRAGAPSPIDLAKKHFAWTPYQVTLDDVAKLNWRIPTPSIDYEQVNDTSLSITWNWNNSIIQPRRIRFTLTKIGESERSVYLFDVDAHKATINDLDVVQHLLFVEDLRLQEGTYQLCASFLDTGDSHGYWTCQLHDRNELEIPNPHDSISRSVPKSVSCNSGCFCEPSKLTGDAMTIHWPSVDSSTSLVDDYLVHYMHGMDDDESTNAIATTENAIELTGLVPNSEYRVMIEARNVVGSTYGQWFKCTSPIQQQLPAPTNLRVNVLNAMMVRINWTPVPLDVRWSTPIGYVITVYSNEQNSMEYNVVGGFTDYLLISDLNPNTLYVLNIAARSMANGMNFSDRSKNATWKMPHANGTIEDPKMTTEIVFELRDIILIAVVIIGIVVLIVSCVCWLCLRKGKKTTFITDDNGSAGNLERPNTYELQDLLPKSNPGTLLTRLSTIPDAQLPLIQHSDEQEQLTVPTTRLLSTSVFENTDFDAKGGTDGKGQIDKRRTKLEKLMNDEVPLISQWPMEELKPTTSSVQNASLSISVTSSDDDTSADRPIIKVAQAQKQRLRMLLDHGRPLRVQRATSCQVQNESTDYGIGLQAMLGNEKPCKNAFSTVPGDFSSDLSHSPVIALSLQSWSHDDHERTPFLQPNEQGTPSRCLRSFTPRVTPSVIVLPSPQHQHGGALTSSLPNLTDSGIVYDELHHHNQHGHPHDHSRFGPDNSIR